MTAQSVVVATIVAVCAVFSVWRLMSMRLRLKTLDVLSVLPGVAYMPGVALLRRKTLAKLSGGGCGACQAAVNENVRPANQKPGALRR